MSGPVRTEDVLPTTQEPNAAGPDQDGPDALGPAEVEITTSRTAQVGGHPVRRALPRHGRRTVGAWCFADHFGPDQVTPDDAVAIGPHPHMGLQTVTWLLAGQLVHRDSLGSEQLIRPGQLNLMTAGHGVSHAEESVAYRGEVHGVQLWVAQPEATRHTGPAFEHHAELPRLSLGASTATILVGAFAGATSIARRDTDHVGVDIEAAPGRLALPLHRRHEHAIIVLDGAVVAEGRTVAPGRLAYFSTGRAELVVSIAQPTRMLLLGGAPFESPVLMWWNFVARSREEVTRACSDWNDGAARFGTTASGLARSRAPLPQWQVPGR